jgi:TonB family protein
MNRICVLLLLVTFALAQEPLPTNPPRFDVGTIATGFYINNCLGFSYPVPDDWVIDTQVLGTAPGAAKHQPGGGLILLVLDQHTKRPFFNRMVISSTDASAIKLDTAEFVSRFVHAQSNDPETSRKILKEPYAVEFAGKPFFRSDFSDQHGDSILYKSFLSTRFRGNFLEWTLVTGSPEELDSAVNSLQKLVFRQDQPDPACVMGKEEAQAGLISGIISSSPSLPAIAFPQRVRVSQGVAQGLLLKKVQPAYPGIARENGIQGTVVLRAEINTSGDVAELTVVSGDPALAPAAIEAVKQWKFKPYLLNNRAVNVETQVTVIFSLQRR